MESPTTYELRNCTIEDFIGVEDEFEKMQGGVNGSLLCLDDLDAS
jgi:hypothetical protein